MCVFIVHFTFPGRKHKYKCYQVKIYLINHRPSLTDLRWVSPRSPEAAWSRAGPCWRWGRRARSGWRNSREFSAWCWWWRWCPRRARGSTRTRCCSASRACLATTTSCQGVKLESVLDIGKLLFWLVSWEATPERFLLHSTIPHLSRTIHHSPWNCWGPRPSRTGASDPTEKALVLCRWLIFIAACGFFYLYLYAGQTLLYK